MLKFGVRRLLFGPEQEPYYTDIFSHSTRALNEDTLVIFTFVSSIQSNDFPSKLCIGLPLTYFRSLVKSILLSFHENFVEIQPCSFYILLWIFVHGRFTKLYF